MSSFTWLNLTDLHMGMGEQDWLWPRARHSFLNDLRGQLRGTNGQPSAIGRVHAVIFTGDLVQRGAAEEFGQLGRFFDDLWNVLGEQVPVLTVPGNHDLARPPRNDIAVRMLTSHWRDDETRRQFWTDPESAERQVVVSALREYCNWWRTSCPCDGVELNEGLLPGDFSASLEGDGCRVGVVGLNTTFLQLTDDDYTGRLSMHPRQLEAAVGGDAPRWVEGHDACILMTHHPPAWLEPEARDLFFEQIQAHGQFAVHLHGHMHETRSERTTKDGVEERRSWQGRSLCGLEHAGRDRLTRSHGYAIGRIEIHPDRGRLMFWPRQLVPRGGQLAFDWDTSQRRVDGDNHTVPAEWWRSGPPPPPPLPPLHVERPVLPPRPRLTPAEVDARRFVGRKGLLRDAVEAARRVASLPAGDAAPGDAVQLLWYHGFGGLGKTSFLRRAYVEIERDVPGMGVALVDWFDPTWRQPAGDRLLSVQDLLDSLAYRLGHLYGVEALDPYWSARARAGQAAPVRANLEARFEEALAAIQAGSHAPERIVSGGEQFSADDPAARERAFHRSRLARLLANAGAAEGTPAFRVHLRTLVGSADTRRRLVERWAQECFAEDAADAAVLQPEALMADALRSVIVELARRNPLLVMLDTHELLGEEYDGWLRRVLTGLLDGQARVLVLVSGRFAPHPAWLGQVDESRRRVVAFDQTAHFSAPDVLQLLDEAQPGGPGHDALADAIMAYTRGWPLAVSMLIDPYRRDAAAFGGWTATEVERILPPEEVRLQVTKAVTDRVLLHVLREDDSPAGDFAAVIAMVVCTRRRLDLLRELWSDVGYVERLTQLQGAHSFVQGNDVHPTVRGYLRAQFREVPPPLLPGIVDTLIAAHATVQSHARPGDETYMDDLVERLNLLSWKAEEKSLAAIAHGLAVCIAFELPVGDLAGLAAEVPAWTHTGQRARARMAALAQYPVWYGRVPFVNDPCLAPLLASPDYAASDLERGASALLAGLGSSRDGQHRAAVRYLDAALHLLGTRVPREDEIAGAYFDASVALNDPEMVRHAFAQCARVGEPLVSRWLQRFYALHDTQLQEGSTDADRAAFQASIQTVVTCASEMFGRMQAEEVGVDVDAFDPSPLLLLHAHMLGRHWGRKREADRIYAGLRPGSENSVVVAVRLDFAEYLGRTGREAEGAAVIRELLAGSPRMTLDELDPADLTRAGSSLRRMSPAVLETVEGRAAATYLVVHANAVDARRDARALADAAVLAKRLRLPEADDLAGRALAAAEGESASRINSVVWALHEGPLRLTESAVLATEACERDPDNEYLLQTLAAVLGRAGRWDEADEHLVRWAARTSGERLMDGWRDFVSLFQDAVRQEQAEMLARALRTAPESYPWPEALAALRACGGDASAHPRPGDALVAELAEQMRADRRFDFPAIGSAHLDGAFGAADAPPGPAQGGLVP